MAVGGAIRSFTLDVDELDRVGHDLNRPESVVAEPDGTLWASDGRGGTTRIDPDGGQEFYGGWGGEPNGLAIDPRSPIGPGGSPGVHLGSLAMADLPTFRSPVPGLPMAHWRRR
jgi:hypothetical protein